MRAEKNVEFMNSSSKYYENTNLLRVFFYTHVQNTL